MDACAEEDRELPCPATPYRSADGTCNNLQHPRAWGVAMRPFRRAMPPAYEDGVSKPRSLGLPSAREVSLMVHRPLYRNDPDFTVMLAVWGQFLDHDITATALSQVRYTKNISPEIMITMFPNLPEFRHHKYTGQIYMANRANNRRYVVRQESNSFQKKRECFQILDGFGP